MKNWKEIEKEIKVIDEKIELLEDIYNFSDNRSHLDDFLNKKITDLQELKQYLKKQL